MSEKPSGSQNSNVRTIKQENSDVGKAWTEINDKLKSTPTMVFSVIGDSDSFVPRPWAKSVFQTALTEAAKSGGDTWILYRGYDYGVSSIVRNAYRKYGDMKFRAKSRDVLKDDKERHVKLISIAGNTTSQKTHHTTKKEKMMGDVKEENLDVVEDQREIRTIKDTRHSKKPIVTDPTEAECSIEPTDKTSFLLDFEEYISKQEVPFLTPTVDLKLPIPTVLLACEGDIDTIEHIAGALKRNIPVIIIKGSGKAADLILDYMENEKLPRRKASILFGIQFDEKTIGKITGHLIDIATTSDLVSVFDVNSDDPLMLSYVVGEAIVSCWAMGEILSNADASVKNLQGTHRENPLHALRRNETTHIFTTVSVGHLRKSNVVMPELEEIEKGFSQNRESNAYILHTQFSSATSLPLYFYIEYQFLQELGYLKDHGHRLLFEALIANRCDYVRVLLDQGVPFRLQNLADLYEETVSCKDCHFEKDDCLHIQWLLKQIAEKKAKELCFTQRKFLKKAQKKIEKKETKILKLEEKLNRCSDPKEKKTIQSKIDKNREEIAEFEKNKEDFVKDDERQIKVAESAKELCRRILGYKETDEMAENDDMEENSGHEEIQNENKEQNSNDVKVSDILLWAILANRTELAEICWLRTKNHLLKGLVCAAVLRKLSKKANNVKEQNMSTEFANHARMFEDKCLTIMDGMHEEDYENAIDLMDDEANVWGIKSSPLIFAHENFMYDVVAHTSSQKSMNKQWYNNLPPDFWPFLKSLRWKTRDFITAPLTKYVFNYFMFFIMLVLYSAFVLTSISDEYYSLGTAKVFEYFVYFWGAGDLIEELICCFGCLESRGRSHRGYWSKLKRYLYDFWNAVDLLSYALLITALFVRHFHPSTNYTVARRMFSLSLLVMYLRFLEVFLVHRKMGPTLIMIKEMLKDLLHFLLLAVFVVVGVGMFYHANLWPDHPTIWSGNWINWRIWKIIYYPYWQLYGEINNEFLEGEDLSSCTNVTSIWKTDTSIERCPQEDWTVSAVAAFYMLFSNLLLVNLVIAMFSYTFERVQENAEKLWRFHRCTVINDYKQRLPSPLNLIFLPYRFCCCPGRKGWCKDKIRVCLNRKKVQKELEIGKKQRDYRIQLQRHTAFKIFNKM